jgi:hypothetical protein
MKEMESKGTGPYKGPSGTGREITRQKEEEKERKYTGAQMDKKHERLERGNEELAGAGF